MTVRDENVLSGTRGHFLLDAVIIRNHPNPFNPSTIIEYSLPEESHILLEVYSPTGRRIARLEHGYRGAGSHAVEFTPGAGAVSGPYLYVLKTDFGVKSGRMMLSK